MHIFSQSSQHLHSNHSAFVVYLQLLYDQSLNNKAFYDLFYTFSTDCFVLLSLPPPSNLKFDRPWKFISNANLEEFTRSFLDEDSELERDLSPRLLPTPFGFTSSTAGGE